MIRIVYVIDIGADVTYQLAEPLIWSMVEICALIICSCIPSLRQVAAKIPGLNSALGLSSGGGSKEYYGRSGNNNFSIQLRGRNGPAPFGMTSRVVASTMGRTSTNDSQEEIFPHRSDQPGAIMVTTEVEHCIESDPESAATFTMFTDGIPKHNESTISLPERSGHVSQTKNHGGKSWSRRSK